MLLIGGIGEGSVAGVEQFVAVRDEDIAGQEPGQAAEQEAFTDAQDDRVAGEPPCSTAEAQRRAICLSGTATRECVIASWEPVVMAFVQIRQPLSLATQENS